MDFRYLVHIIALCSSMVAAVPYTIVEQKSTREKIFLTIVGDMDDAVLLRLAVSRLGPKKITSGKIALFPTVLDRLLGGAQHSYECDPTTRQSEIIANPLPRGSKCARVAEVIKLGTSILFRKVDGSCRVTTQLLSGPDPMRKRVGKIVVQILDLDGAVRFPEERGREVRSHLIVQMDEGVLEEDAEAATLALMKTFRLRDVSVMFGSGTRFDSDCHFPLRFGFAQSRQAPSGKPINIYCADDELAIRCHRE